MAIDVSQEIKVIQEMGVPQDKNDKNITHNIIGTKLDAFKVF